MSRLFAAAWISTFLSKSTITMLPRQQKFWPTLPSHLRYFQHLSPSLLSFASWFWVQTFSPAYWLLQNESAKAAKVIRKIQTFVKKIFGDNKQPCLSWDVISKRYHSDQVDERFWHVIITPPCWRRPVLIAVIRLWSKFIWSSYSPSGDALLRTRLKNYP